MTAIGFTLPVIMFGRRWDSLGDLDYYRGMVEAAQALEAAKSTTSLDAMIRDMELFREAHSDEVK